MSQYAKFEGQDISFRGVLEGCLIGVAILDARSKRRLFVNQAFVEMLEGVSAEDLLTRDISETWVDQDALARNLRHMDAGAHLVKTETERLTLTGKPIWLLMHTQEIQFEGRAALLNWHVDITDRKMAESTVRASQEQLNAQIADLRDKEERLEEQAGALVELAEEQAGMKAELARLNEHKDKFFSIIAHDLRGPFNAMLGYSELLSQSALTMEREALAEYGASVHEAAQQSFKLMENLLEWSRLQMDRISVEIEVFNLCEPIRTNVDLLSPVAAEKGVSLISDVARPVMARADVNMIDTILRNLINNAIKFTPEGGRITVSAVQAGTEGQIRVVDSGVGVSQDQLADLLRIDRKTTTTGTAGETGTGLGLPLCAELIEKQGGTIALDSVLGKGMIATLSLPR